MNNLDQNSHKSDQAQEGAPSTAVKVEAVDPRAQPPFEPEEPVESGSERGADSATRTDVAKEIESRIIESLKTCFDPEIPVNIYELGLIYSIEVAPQGSVVVRMTLTSPACPVAGSLPPEVEAKVRGIRGVAGATVDLVWDPPWNPSMMSEAAKLQLNMM